MDKVLVILRKQDYIFLRCLMNTVSTSKARGVVCLSHPLAGYSHLLDPLAIAQLSLSKNQQYQAGYLNSLSSLVSNGNITTNGYHGNRTVPDLSPKSDPLGNLGARTHDQGNIF